MNDKLLHLINSFVLNKTNSVCQRIHTQYIYFLLCPYSGWFVLSLSLLVIRWRK